MADLTKQLPTRFHIGTQKAGSTFFYNLLASHLDTSLPTQSEVHYYHKYFDRGEDWYLSLFPKKGIKIDTSPKYFMNGETVAPRIAEAVGADARFLLILRNPIDLINSHYQMHAVSGHFKRHPDRYPVVPKNVVDCVQRYPDFLKQALYAKQLNEEWLQYFATSQCKIIIFEEFIKDTDRIMDEVLNFWQLPPRQLSAPAASKNRMLKYHWLFVLRGKIMARPVLKRLFKQNTFANYVYERWLTQSSSSSITPIERAELAALLANDVGELEAILDRPVEVWTDFKNL